MAPVVLLPLGHESPVRRWPHLGRHPLLWQLPLLALAAAGLTAVW